MLKSVKRGKKEKIQEFSLILLVSKEESDRTPSELIRVVEG